MSRKTWQILYRGFVRFLRSNWYFGVLCLFVLILCLCCSWWPGSKCQFGALCLAWPRQFGDWLHYNLSIIRFNYLLVSSSKYWSSYDRCDKCPSRGLSNLRTREIHIFLFYLIFHIQCSFSLPQFWHQNMIQADDTLHKMLQPHTAHASGIKASPLLSANWTRLSFVLEQFLAPKEDTMLREADMREKCSFY